MSDAKASSDGSNVIGYERLRYGRYYADFRRDKRLMPETYHCVIQREGSAEILRWTQHQSLEDAVSVARIEMKRLAQQEHTHSQQSPLQPT
ncbi:MAG TPA: hypothetical protein VLW06_00200 [Terriglobales bacterium]|nr:hypothetical protein [Terriglobales bacterium]